MEIFIAKELGFCFGVKRAVKTAQEAADAASDAADLLSDKSTPVYTLGPIVHNDTVVESLQDVGVWAKEAIDEINTGTIVIRAHGVPPEVLQAAEDKGLHVIDATCPLVTRVQKLAKTLHDDGYQVVIYGKPEHPEVIGIAGWASGAAAGSAAVVQSLDEVAALPRRKKIGVVSQTTKIPANYQAIVGALMSKGMEVRAYNTICSATAHRQAAAVEVAQQVDVMVVIGGAHSSNSRRLVEVCAEVNPRTHRVATENELDAAWFTGTTKVGITAGASTPDVTIDAVVDWLKAQPI